MSIVRVVVLCLLLAGCDAPIAAVYGIPIVDPAAQASVARHVTVKPDPHTGLIDIVGPTVFHEKNLLDDTYLVRSWVDPRTGPEGDQFQILVTGKFSKRVYLRQAFSGGEKLSTRIIDRERTKCLDSCVIDEVVGIDISEADLARYAAAGLSFKILGRRASIEMSIPPAYLAAVLAAHRNTRARLPG